MKKQCKCKEKLIKENKKLNNRIKELETEVANLKKDIIDLYTNDNEDRTTSYDVDNLPEDFKR